METWARCNSGQLVYGISFTQESFGKLKGPINFPPTVKLSDIVQDEGNQGVGTTPWVIGGAVLLGLALYSTRKANQ